MIEDLLLRWVVTGLFVLSAAEWGFAVVTRRRVWTAIVRYGLHFVMSVAMAVMVWPWGTRLPTTGPAVFFGLAAVWFVVATTFVSENTGAKRAEYGYHASMMLAMAWMYTVISRPGDMAMPDMTMPATDMPARGGSPGWITTIDCSGSRDSSLLWPSGQSSSRLSDRAARRAVGGWTAWVRR
jgi:Domain of unknown function (DUF5134)